jgi:23S rRNA (guanosine2251-2'-O)-methyltransferase
MSKLVRKKPSASSEHIVYGFHAVTQILRYASFRAKKIFIARSKDSAEIEALAQQAHIACEYIDRDVLLRRFNLGSEAQGIVLSCAPFVYTPLAELLKNPRHKLVILDNWQDAANIGRAARAALCFGASGLIICTDRSAQITSASEKAAVGALARLPVAQIGNLASALKKIKEDGFFVYGADEHGEVSLASCDFAPKVAIVIGQEGAGLRELTKKNCDILVTVPMANNDICLNAADTALIFLYELYK